MKNIILIGFMGAGKSTIASDIATRKSCVLKELDGLIVEKAGKSIRSIFSDEGESAFRDMETSVLQSLSSLDQVVISTGGGIVGRSENWELMRKTGTIVYLRACWETLAQRICGSEERPLADDLEKAKLLFEKRKPLYEMADLVVDTDGRTPEEVVSDILSQVTGR